MYKCSVQVSAWSEGIVSVTEVSNVKGHDLVDLCSRVLLTTDWLCILCFRDCPSLVDRLIVSYDFMPPMDGIDLNNAWFEAQASLAHIVDIFPEDEAREADNCERESLQKRKDKVKVILEELLGNRHVKGQQKGAL